MKREALRHPKMFALASLLGCSRPEAIGYLTLLWDYTGEVATGGDIGKWPNAAIASACDWKGDPDVFVDALVSGHWLDDVRTHDAAARLLVHHWPDHCEQWVRRKIGRSNDLRFHRFYEQTMSGHCPDTVRTHDHPSEPNRTEPNQSKPNRTEPKTTKTPSDDGDRPRDDAGGFEGFWKVVARKVGKDAARRAYGKARQRLCKERGWKPEQARAFLAERMAAFAQSPKAAGKFCPHPATWLNEGRYDDDPAEWQRRDDDEPPPLDISKLNFGDDE